MCKLCHMVLRFPFSGEVLLFSASASASASARIVQDLVDEVEKDRRREKDERIRGAGLDTADIEEDYMGVGPLIQKLEKEKLKDSPDLNRFEEPSDSDDEDERFDDFASKFKKHQDLLNNFTEAATLDDDDDESN